MEVSMILVERWLLCLAHVQMALIQRQCSTEVVNVLLGPVVVLVMVVHGSWECKGVIVIIVC